MRTQTKNRLSMEAVKIDSKPKQVSKLNQNVTKKCITKKITRNQLQSQQTKIHENNDNNEAIEVNYDNVYKYFIDYNNLSYILKFLDIETLIKCASLNLKIRIMVKWHFVDNQYTKQIKSYEKLKKDKLQQAISEHFIRRDRLQKLIDEGLQNELMKLSPITQSIYVRQIQLGMKVNGISLNSINQVLPHIQEKGIRHCFSDIFEQRIVKPKEEISNFKINYHENKLVSSFLYILQEYVQEMKDYKYSFKKQKPVIKKYQNYCYQKTFEKLRPKVVQQFNARNMKNGSLFDFCNKNVFGLIVQFLEFKEIYNLKLTSKYLSNFVDLSVEIKLNKLLNKRDALLHELEIPYERMSIYENYIHFEHFLNITNGTFQNAEVNIPICQEILSKLMTVNIPSQAFDKNASLYTLKDNYFQINNKIVIQTLREFILLNSVESIENEIKNHPDYQEKGYSLYFSFLFQYLKCLDQTCQQEIPAVNIKRSLEKYKKHLESIQREIYLIQKLLNPKLGKIPIYFKNAYPVKKVLGRYKIARNGIQTIFG